MRQDHVKCFMLKISIKHFIYFSHTNHPPPNPLISHNHYGQRPSTVSYSLSSPPSHWWLPSPTLSLSLSLTQQSILGQALPNSKQHHLPVPPNVVGSSHFTLFNLTFSFSLTKPNPNSYSPISHPTHTFSLQIRA